MQALAYFPVFENYRFLNSRFFKTVVFLTAVFEVPLL